MVRCRLAEVPVAAAMPTLRRRLDADVVAADAATDRLDFDVVAVAVAAEVPTDDDDDDDWALIIRKRALACDALERIVVRTGSYPGVC
jgi:hypothetical protein